MNAFALTGRVDIPSTITQGVALGYVLLGFQPVLPITIRNFSQMAFYF